MGLGFVYAANATITRFNKTNICATDKINRVQCFQGSCITGLLSRLPYSYFFPPMLLWSVFLSPGTLHSHITLLLSFSHHQGQKVATCLFITCPRSLETLSSCKCSYLLATSSPPKSLWTERLIRANVSVSQKSPMKRRKKKSNDPLKWTLQGGCVW